MFTLGPQNIVIVYLESTNFPNIILHNYSHTRFCRFFFFVLIYTCLRVLLNVHLFILMTLRFIKNILCIGMEINQGNVIL